MRGPVTGHAARLAHGGAGSYVDVLGADASIALDRVHRTRVWQDARDADAVSAIAAEAGFAADVATTPTVHRSDLRGLIQAGSDLRFVRRLARRNGFVAWLSTDALTGVDTFHFKAPPVDGAPVATLVVNQPGANTAAIDLSWDSDRPTAIDATQIDLTSGGDLDASGTSSPTRALGAVRFADAVAAPQSMRIAAPGDDSTEVQASAGGRWSTPSGSCKRAWRRPSPASGWPCARTRWSRSRGRARCIPGCGWSPAFATSSMRPDTA